MVNQQHLRLLTLAVVTASLFTFSVGRPDGARVVRQSLIDPLSVEFPSGERLTPIDDAIVEPLSPFNDPNGAAEVETQLFDHTGIEDVQLSTNFQVRDFLLTNPVSSMPYFRLSPRLVECLQRVVDAASGRQLLILDGYRQDRAPTPADAEFPEPTTTSGHIRGRGADVRFMDTADRASLVVLAEHIVDVCYPLFVSYGSRMRLGLLRGGIHVSFTGGFSGETVDNLNGIHPISGTWAEDLASMTPSEWSDWVNDRVFNNFAFPPLPCINLQEFRCRSGSCVPNGRVCDGQFDCGPNDNSDELGVSSECGRNSESAGAEAPPSTTTPPPVTVAPTSAPTWCFPGDSIVQTEHTSKAMTDLQIGDKILSVSSNGELVYSSVIAFAARLPSKKLEFVQLETEDGYSIRLTKTHLIFRNSSTTHKETVFASSIRPGDSVYIIDSDQEGAMESTDNSLKPSQVTAVSTLRSMGAYGPVTTEGTIVVDGVAASCYAVVSDHSMVHTTFAPLRYLNHLVPSVVGTEQEGLHWYPEFLKAVGKYVYMYQPFGGDLLHSEVSL